MQEATGPSESQVGRGRTVLEPTHTVSLRTVGVGAATRDYRAQLMRELMDREMLDALAFASPDFFKFATNFDMDVAGFERPTLCVVPRNGDPFVILHELSTNHWALCADPARRWVADASFYSEHPRVRQRLPRSEERRVGRECEAR